MRLMEELCALAAWAGPTSRAAWDLPPQAVPAVRRPPPHPSTPLSELRPSTRPEAVTRERAARFPQRPTPSRNGTRSQRVRLPLLRVPHPQIPSLSAIAAWDTLTPRLCIPKTPNVLSRRAPTRCPAQATWVALNRCAPHRVLDPVSVTHTCDVTRRVDAPSTLLRRGERAHDAKQVGWAPRRGQNRHTRPVCPSPPTWPYHHRPDAPCCDRGGRGRLCMETVDYRPHSRACGITVKHASHGSDNTPHASTCHISTEHARDAKRLARRVCTCPQRR